MSFLTSENHHLRRAVHLINKVMNAQRARTYSRFRRVDHKIRNLERSVSDLANNNNNNNGVDNGGNGKTMPKRRPSNRRHRNYNNYRRHRNYNNYRRYENYNNYRRHRNYNNYGVDNGGDGETMVKRRPYRRQRNFNFNRFEW